MPVLTVPAPLRQRLGDEATDSLVVLINAANDDARDNVIEIVSERFERRLSEEIRSLEVRLTERIVQVEVRLNERIAQVESRLTERIAQVETHFAGEIATLRVEIAQNRMEIAHNRSDLIRWMFAFWIGQIVVTATLFTLLR